MDDDVLACFGRLSEPGKLLTNNVEQNSRRSEQHERHIIEITILRWIMDGRYGGREGISWFLHSASYSYLLSLSVTDSRSEVIPVKDSR